MANPESSSPLTGKPNLDNLPELVYSRLLEYLDLDDVCVLKLVSKKLHSIGKEYNVRELCFMPQNFYEDMGHYFDNRWFSTAKSIKPINQLDSSKLDLLVYPSENILNLRYLKIEVCPTLFDINDLNKFSKLQILELLRLELSFEHHLNLPELKALSIRFGTKDCGSLEIDTPKLHHLNVDSKFHYKLRDNEIEFKDPLSVKHLTAYKPSKDILIFKSLESLELNGFLLNIRIDLLKFDHLKKLRINSLLIDNDTDFLKDLFESKEDDLVIVLGDVRIRNIDKIDEYAKMSNPFKFQLDNYCALEDGQNSLKSIDFGNLLSFVPYYLPSNFVKKFNNIQMVGISSEITDEKQLIKFITGCKYLCDLDVRVFLSQQFFDQLPEISSLFRLRISHRDTDLDFRFIINIPYLVRLDAENCDVLEDNDLNLNEFKNLRRLKFRIENSAGSFNHVDLRKKSCDNYLIDCGKWTDKLTKKKCYTFDDLLKWLDDVRSDKSEE